MKAVFFDRDNTLTHDEGYCHLVADFKWLEGAPEALKRLKDHNILVFIVTNQGGIGRQFFTQDDMELFHSHLKEQAILAGGEITDIAFCPHHPKAVSPDMRACECRKPQAGMFYALADKWDIDLENSVMIGDRQSDVSAGKAAGMASYLSDPASCLDRLVSHVITTHFSDSH